MNQTRKQLQTTSLPNLASHTLTTRIMGHILQRHRIDIIEHYISAQSGIVMRERYISVPGICQKSINSQSTVLYRQRINDILKFRFHSNKIIFYRLESFSSKLPLDFK